MDSRILCQNNFDISVEKKLYAPNFNLFLFIVIKCRYIQTREEKFSRFFFHLLSMALLFVFSFFLRISFHNFLLLLFLGCMFLEIEVHEVNDDDGRLMVLCQYNKHRFFCVLFLNLFFFFC